jgi:hexokinase
MNGTNGDASHSTNNQDRIKRLLEKSWPIEDHLKDDNADGLFSWIGERIAEVVEDGCREFNLPPSETLALGVTFSFPMLQHSLSEAKLLSMGKGFTIAPNTDLGICLEQGYARSKSAKLPQIKVTAIANDSVSTLVSFIYNFDGSHGQRASMGLILGTGSNATIPIKLSLLHPSKWPHNISVLEGESTKDVKIAVNTEWSINGTEAPMRKLGLITPWDDQLSAQNEKPGFQPLEYMTAGRYLGELGRVMLLDYMMNTLGTSRDALPAKLLQPYSLSTTFLSHFKPLEPASLLARLEQQFPASTAQKPFAWTEHLAEALYRVAKAIELRAAGIIAAAIVALQMLAGDLPADGSVESCEAKELGVGYTGGCIVHFQDYLADCQAFVDRLVERRMQTSPVKVVLTPCHDGGITGAGILVSAASSSKEAEMS